MIDDAVIHDSLADGHLPFRSSIAESSIIHAVTSLTLTHFRNYGTLSLNVDPTPVILTGENGAGKTNLLEAISLLTPGRGFRKARIASLDRQQESDFASGWAVAATVTGRHGENTIGTGRDTSQNSESEKRLVKIDGKARGQTELAKHFTALWLVPQMDQLFLESDSSRRRFLDRLVYGFDAEHASRISAYEQTMRERNRLLADSHAADPLWLDALEQKMAEKTVAIAAARLEALERLNHAIRQSPLSFPKAALGFEGEAETLLSQGIPALEAEERWRAWWKSRRAYDAAAGRTTGGAHKTTLTAWHTGKNMPAHLCSTGEQKALLLCILLAQARAMAAWAGTVPVLLLDEVIAHLDARRRGELFDEIAETRAQAWMTGTDAADFSMAKGKAQFFAVKSSKIECFS